MRQYGPGPTARVQAGFTLMELLLSITIIGVLAGMSAPFYQTFVQRNDLDITAQRLTSSLRRAQSYARVGDSDTAWSVEVAGGNVTLFKGTSYGSRDTNYDEVDTIPDSITPSGLSEIQFAKFTAAPNATGTFTLTSSTGDIRTVTVNAQGMVQQ